MVTLGGQPTPQHARVCREHDDLDREDRQGGRVEGIPADVGDRVVGEVPGDDRSKAAGVLDDEGGDKAEEGGEGQLEPRVEG